MLDYKEQLNNEKEQIRFALLKEKEELRKKKIKKKEKIRKELTAEM